MARKWSVSSSYHQVRLYERLPLSRRKYVEYGTALLSMPYKGCFRLPELPAAQAPPKCQP
ncbi:hypothetical protein CD932_08820 [Janthinobacterium sp. PC23-8]|nr:hypothetical protein CD932_08820 [Janthinobacterium sp. PC23-8]